KMFYLPGDAKTVASEMTRLAAGKRHVVYVQWFLSTSDPEQLLPFLLQRYGKLTDDHTFRGYREREYAIPAGSTFELVQPRQIQPVDFGGLFQLDAAGYGPSIEGDSRLAESLARPEAVSGQKLMLALRWRLLKPAGKDYKVSAYLTDGRDHLAGQVDLTLQRGQATTQKWHAGDEATNYYVMQTMGGLMPGTYQLHLAVYPAGGVERLSVLDAAGAPQGGNAVLGKVQVLPPRGPVALASLGIPHSLRQTPGASVQLAGYGLPKTDFLQGDSLPLTLFWQVGAALPANPPVAIALEPVQAEGGGGAWTWSGQPSFPVSQWQPGWALRGWYEPALPADLAPGSYQLLAGLGQPTTRLATIQIQARQRSFAAPRPQHPVTASLGQSVELLGYDLDRPEYKPGDTVHLTLYWRAAAPVATSYTVFAHVLDGTRHLAAQRDAIPVQGTMPTVAWAPGQVVTDEYDLPLPRSLPGGAYQLETGMYRAETGQRLAARSTQLNVIDNGILLGPLVVR
ncbi:MAG: hypothetical protein KGJ86_08235, partial [Chloroflexota bacterium]|nr:hypothetical protein [Chloroflexota bacterium]